MGSLAQTATDILKQLLAIVGAALSGAMYQKSRDQAAQDKATSAGLAKAAEVDVVSRKQTQADKVSYLKKQGLLRD